MTKFTSFGTDSAEQVWGLVSDGVGSATIGVFYLHPSLGMEPDGWHVANYTF